MPNKKDSTEFIQLLAIEIENQKNSYKGYYHLNEENYARFIELYEFFYALAYESDGKIVKVTIKPPNIRGDFTVELPIIDLYGDNLPFFLNKLSNADVFGITPSASHTLLLDITVNDIWEKALDEQ